MASERGDGCVPNPAPNWVWVDESVAPTAGDSGGPVFLNNSAYGMMNCSVSGSNAVIYGAIDFLEQGLGVTVPTN